MSLITAHRILIWTFAAFSAFLCWHEVERFRETGAVPDLAFGIGSGIIAFGCVVYLFRARHLKRGS